MTASPEFSLARRGAVIAGSREAMFSGPNPRHHSTSSFLPHQAKEQAEILPDGSVFVSGSPAMQAIREQIEKIAVYNIPVLVLGESGTGKEVVARLIHARSERAHRPFLKVNCAALPAALMESELFGYERGAFTGAMRSTPGKFEFCASGTILLDEIGEIPPMLQAKLLHVLQDLAFSRLGSPTSIKVDVRIIAATNIDICEALESGALRQDLYYRLNTFVLRIPPLRARQNEIPVLIEHFARRFAALYDRPLPRPSRKLIAACLEYPWPGNVRELQSFTKRLLFVEDEDHAIRELQGYRHDRIAESSDGARSDSAPLDLKKLGRAVKCNVEKPAIERVLHETRFNRSAAAKRLKISYKGLLLKLREYDLDGKSVQTRIDEPEFQG